MSQSPTPPLRSPRSKPHRPHHTDRNSLERAARSGWAGTVPGSGAVKQALNHQRRNTQREHHDRPPPERPGQHVPVRRRHRAVPRRRLEHQVHVRPVGRHQQFSRVPARPPSPSSPPAAVMEPSEAVCLDPAAATALLRWPMWCSDAVSADLRTGRRAAHPRVLLQVSAPTGVVHCS